MTQTTEKRTETRTVPSGQVARSALWRRRLFEAEAGLTRHLVEARAGSHMQELLRVKHEIFEELPTTDDEAAWKAAFFHAQAVMEQFIVNTFGHEELAQWAASNSSIYTAIDNEPNHDASVPLERLDNQAALYESDTEWQERNPERAVLTIGHCAIWDYRERARERGVTITLESPCEYCVPATTAMITKKGLNAEHLLTDDEVCGRGCVWTASRGPATIPETAISPTSEERPT